MRWLDPHVYIIRYFKSFKTRGENLAEHYRLARYAYSDHILDTI